MRRTIIFALLLVFPASIHAGVIKWEGKPISVSISTERLTRIEFPETLRSVVVLHAAELGFRHPVTRQEMKWQMALPADLEAVLGRLRERAGG